MTDHPLPGGAHHLTDALAVTGCITVSSTILAAWFRIIRTDSPFDRPMGEKHPAFRAHRIFTLWMNINIQSRYFRIQSISGSVFQPAINGDKIGQNPDILTDLPELLS